MSMGNEPAYPVPRQEFTNHFGNKVVILEQFGLTKREAFSMAAMQGMRATLPVGWGDYEAIAGMAVDQADALLAALAANGGTQG